LCRYIDAIPTKDIGVTGFVIEWATLHQQELFADWDLARAREELQKIPPLE
jgi:hypothetical protein